MNRKRTEQGL